MIYMKQLNFLLLALGLILGTSCISTRSSEPDPSPSVRMDTVKAANERINLQYPGKVKAGQDISLAFRVSGTIQRFAVKEGTHVRQGQLLAELDPTDYQVQLDATEAEYRQVKGEAERVIALYNDHGTTPNAYDKAVYGLQQITAKYKHHQDQLAYTRLYAPFDGFVQKRLFEAHETVGAGMPVLAMVSAGAPEVEINLPAADYIQRNRFGTYHCTFDLYPGKTYPLQFISITPKANANQLYTLRLQLVPGDLPLPSPGMNTLVTIDCEDNADTTLSVSTGSLLQDGGQTYVFVFQPQTQTVHRCPVTPVRLLSNGRTLITSSELKRGDQIVGSGVHHIQDGTTVEPLPAVSPTNVGGLL